VGQKDLFPTSDNLHPSLAISGRFVPLPSNARVVVLILRIIVREPTET
jgi:hypothetical protein